MKRVKHFTMLVGTALALATAGRASEMLDLTARYAFSVLNVGYMDHYHHEGKSRDVQLSFAGLAFNQNIQMDPFFLFSDGLKEAGFSFRLKLNSRFYLFPIVFRNFDAHEYGMSINCAFVLR